MYEEKYEESINKLKEVYPLYKDVVFDITNGELGYIGAERIDMNELQRFINSYLGQKVYRAEYVAYADVYARSIDEAIEFSKYIDPIPKLRKVTETNEEKIIY
jgi:hypothetical protein